MNHPSLFVAFTLLLLSCTSSLALAQEREPPTPLYEKEPTAAPGTSSVKQEEVQQLDIPTKRYPMVNRPLEVAFQVGVGLGLTSVPSTIGLFLLESGQTIQPPAPPDFLIDAGTGALTTFIFVVPTAALAVWGFGRGNGSRASLGWTFVGASAGGILASIAYGGSRYSSNQLIDGAGLFGLWVVPIVGAIIGYQASSSWKRGETIYEESPALSFGLSPTRQGFAGTIGFKF